MFNFVALGFFSTNENGELEDPVWWTLEHDALINNVLGKVYWTESSNSMEEAIEKTPYKLLKLDELKE